jgi:hypothetical protein
LGRTRLTAVAVVAAAQAISVSGRTLRSAVIRLHVATPVGRARLRDRILRDVKIHLPGTTRPSEISPSDRHRRKGKIRHGAKILPLGPIRLSEIFPNDRIPRKSRIRRGVKTRRLEPIPAKEIFPIERIPQAVKIRRSETFQSVTSRLGMDLPSFEGTTTTEARSSTAVGRIPRMANARALPEVLLSIATSG